MGTVKFYTGTQEQYDRLRKSRTEELIEKYKGNLDDSESAIETLDKSIGSGGYTSILDISENAITYFDLSLSVCRYNKDSDSIELIEKF